MNNTLLFCVNVKYCDGSESTFEFSKENNSFYTTESNIIDLAKYLIEEVLKPSYELDYEEYRTSPCEYWFFQKYESQVSSIDELPNPLYSLIRKLIELGIITIEENDEDNIVYIKKEFELDIESLQEYYKKCVIDLVEEVHSSRLEDYTDDDLEEENKNYQNLIAQLK